MKGVFGFIAVMVLFAACGGRSMSAEEMQRKLDSIQKSCRATGCSGHKP